MKYLFSMSILLLLYLNIFATTYHTITIDGTNDFDTDEDFTTSTNGYTAYCTWDQNNLYLGYTGSAIGSEESSGKWIIWFIDVDPQESPKTGNGTDDAPSFNTQDWTLPFYADYFFQYRTDEGYYALKSWNGSSWQSSSFNGSMWDNDGANYFELRLPLSDIGSPNKIYILGYFINEASGSEWTFASWPDNSLDGGDGYKSPGNFSHWYGYNLENNVSPDAPANYDQSLPVTLTSFTAQAGDAQVLLQWVTESEIENDAFILERSIDQSNFQKIAEIPGHGNSTIQHVYTYTDNDVTNGMTYYYRLADRDYNGHLTYHQVISATPMSGDHITRLNNQIPERFGLHPNYPNPFNPTTNIQFDLPAKSDGAYQLSLTIYDLNGRQIKQLLHGSYAPGSYRIQWDGTNDVGENVASGIYIYRLITTDGLSATRKMMLIR